MRRCSKLSTIIRWDLWQTDEKCIAIYLRHLEIVQLTGLWHAQSVPGCFEGKGYQVFFRAVTNKLRSHGVEYTPDGVHSDGTSTFEVWGLSLANTLTVCLSLSLSLSPFYIPFGVRLKSNAIGVSNVWPRKRCTSSTNHVNYSRVTRRIKKIRITSRGSLCVR